MSVRLRKVPKASDKRSWIYDNAYENVNVPVLPVFPFFSEEKDSLMALASLAEPTSGNEYCLAMMETALRNNGEFVIIPGTAEYGNKRTGVLWAGASNLQN